MRSTNLPPLLLLLLLNITQIRVYVARQYSQNCGRYFEKRKKSDAEFPGSSVLRMDL